MSKTRVFILLAVSVILSCAATMSRPAAYQVELEECNRKAETLQDSIRCENEVRQRYPLRDGGARPLRPMPEGGDQ